MKKLVMIFVKLILGFVIGTVALLILSMGHGEDEFYAMMLAFIGVLTVWAIFRVYQLILKKNAPAATKFLRYVFAILLIGSPVYAAGLAYQTARCGSLGDPGLWMTVFSSIPNLIVLLLLLVKFEMPFNEGLAAGMVWFTFCVLIGFFSMYLKMWYSWLSFLILLLVFVIGCVAFCFMRNRTPQTANATAHRIIGLIFGTALAVGYNFIFIVFNMKPYH